MVRQIANCDLLRKRSRIGRQIVREWHIEIDTPLRMLDEIRRRPGSNLRNARNINHGARRHGYRMCGVGPTPGASQRLAVQASGDDRCAMDDAIADFRLEYQCAV